MENRNGTHQRQLNYKYDVYHSFGRGSTAQSFPHSFQDVMNHKKLSFIQNQDYFIRGDDNIPISPPHLKAMKKSRILIVSITSTFASSVFCLNELVEILKQMKSTNQLVCPIFVGVDPSDLRNLRNGFDVAMAQQEIRFGRKSEEVKKWKLALCEISNFSGWHLRTPCAQEEKKFAEKVVSWITRSLKKYDVFVSFSGTDTRYDFTGSLYNALHRDGFNTFVEDEGWVNGKKISQFHIQAVAESKFSIIVFSKNYAYSSCRLDALVKIVECIKLKKQQVLPIFYKVNPADVRHQTHNFQEAMTKYENRFGKGSKRVQNWKVALSEVASLKGWHFKDGSVHETIQGIVELVNKSLPRYDIFLSFRGQDTRHTFTGNLYHALCKKGLKTFMDDHALKRGEQISHALDNAIRQSKFSIIVFSENYANSEWCLRELVNILKWNKKKINHQVWPIYYKVNPSDVWEQRKSYGKAMEKHENRFGKGSNVVRKWRSALSQTTNFTGWPFKQGRYEHKFIEQIVVKIISEVQATTQFKTHVL